jgi:hypothetical protein
MTIRGLKGSRWALGAAMGIACLFISDNATLTDTSSLITQANARVGRPMTPGSVAGVARRTTRRAVVGGAAAGAAAGAYYYGGGAGGCYQDAYGVMICQ